MSDDLVKRLREGVIEHRKRLMMQAADQIEELEARAEKAEAERDAAIAALSEEGRMRGDAEAERDEERVRSHRKGYAQGKSAGDAFAESIRQHVLKLEVEVERLREALAKADDLAGAIEADVWENTQTWFALTAYREARDTLKEPDT